MNKEIVSYLQLIINVLKENGTEHLIEEIAKKDYQLGQIIDVLMIED